MRELKFRAWSIEYEEYIEDVIHDGPSWLEAHGYDYVAVSEIFDGDEFIVEQCTCLKDKNGKEIYVGDIIQEEIDFNSKMTDGVFTYVVEWDNDTLSYGLRGNGDSIHDELWQTNLSRKVIGNIHENQDLLGDTNFTNKEAE